MRFMQPLKDSTGEIVIYQRPNIPITSWAVFKLAALLSSNEQLTNTFNILGTLSLLIWATLEITNGVNVFRRLLGLVVFAATIAHYL